MNKYQTIVDLAVEDTTLYYGNRKKATQYVFEVFDAIKEYLEPPDEDSIEVAYLLGDSSEMVVKKSSLLESKLRSDDPIKYNEFTCCIKFQFKSDRYMASTSVYLKIIVADKRCAIFGESFGITDKDAIGSCAYEFLKRKYDTNREMPSIGFIHSSTSDQT